jgi:spoIIIJ-associated protein
MNQPNADDAGERKAIEVRARTVDEAVARGLVRLGGLSRTEVKIEVLSPGKGGVLGFGAEDAVIRLTTLLPGEAPDEVISPPPAEDLPPEVAAAPPSGPETIAETAVGTKPKASRAKPAAPAVPSDEVAAMAVEVVREMLERLGFEPVEVSVGEALLPTPEEDETSLVLSIHGPGTERLMGHQAASLDALQFLARLLVNRRSQSWINLLLDVDGDRARRVKELYQLAEQSAALVMREGRPVSLPPMSPYERRVVHLALHDHPTIATQSIGEGPSRKVTVRRKDQLLPEL